MDSDRPTSIVEELIELQRAQNEWWAHATPEERTAAAIADLRQMPGQAYLFAD
jgi:hypothetical protein